MRTISQLAKKHQISRTAVLYYESVGLLKASRRTLTGYRLYDEGKEKRLESICLYRKAGLPLKDIYTLLGNKRGGSFSKILEQRLSKINEEIQELKNQQRMILALLKNRRISKMGKINKEQWIQLFREAGLSDTQMENWHRAFEKNAPEGHQEFLEFLNISRDEIKAIRTKFAR